jgi:lincosamide nucleotidyltransferase A/C/D/E
VDDLGRLVDVHLVDFSETRPGAQGTTIYSPAGLPFEVGQLEGRGEISGREVRCETAEFHVRGPTGDEPDEQDYLDVLALCRASSIEMPELFKSMGFE